MIKELMHDSIFLAGKSEVATKDDLQVAQDLLDTLMAHRESCVGMAANMIGVRKRYKTIKVQFRLWRCKRARKTSPAGRHRSYSMKWIIVMEF